MASNYRYGVYQCGLRDFGRDSMFDFFSHIAPVNGMVAIFATEKEAEEDAEARNPKRDPMPGAKGSPTFAVCDLNDEATYIPRQNVGRNGTKVVYLGKSAIVKALGN